MGKEKRNWWKLSTIILAIIYLSMTGYALHKRANQEMISIAGQFEIKNSSLQSLLTVVRPNEPFFLCGLETERCVGGMKQG